MICWGVGVFLRVLANLTSRVCSDICDGVSVMCSMCFCRRTRGRADLRVREGDERGGEPFYREVDRDRAELLLENRQDGTFIVRPSPLRGTVGTLSVVQDDRVFHLAIRRRPEDNLLALGTPKTNERCFKDLNSLINYYVSNYLVLFSDNRTTYTLLLPFREQVDWRPLAAPVAEPQPLI